MALAGQVLLSIFMTILDSLYKKFLSNGGETSLCFLSLRRGGTPSAAFLLPNFGARPKSDKIHLIWKQDLFMQ